MFGEEEKAVAEDKKKINKKDLIEISNDAAQMDTTEAKKDSVLPNLP